MPRGNRMGPTGLGPKTGRGLGFCAGYTAPGYGFSRMRRFYRRGFGRGYCNYSVEPNFAISNPEFLKYYQQNTDPENEKQLLKNQVELLQKEMDGINARLKEIDGSENQKEN